MKKMIEMLIFLVILTIAIFILTGCETEYKGEKNWNGVYSFTLEDTNDSGYKFISSGFIIIQGDECIANYTQNGPSSEYTYNRIGECSIENEDVINLSFEDKYKYKCKRNGENLVGELMGQYNLSGCYNTKTLQLEYFGTKEEYEKYMENDKQKNALKVTEEYNGVYSFTLEDTNDSGYKFTSSGFIIIEGNECIANYTQISDTYTKEHNYIGECGLDNDNIFNISLENYYKYKCTKDKNDLIGELVGQYNLSGCDSNKTLILEYFGTKEEYEKFEAEKEHFLNDSIRWGMAPEEVIKVIGKGRESSAPNFSKHLSWIELASSQNDTLVKYIDKYLYLFYDTQLIAYEYTFDEDLSNPYDIYLTVKQLLVNKYGNANSEVFNWIDKTYENEKDKYNEAIKYKDLTIETIWKFNGYQLVITWNYEDVLRVAYVKDGYFENL